MSKTSIGTNDTSRGHGCPCGRSHPDHGKSRAVNARPFDHERMAIAISDAYAAGKASGDPQRGEHVVHYAGDCTSPIKIPKGADRGALFILWEVRCRKCPNCLRAKAIHWALGAVKRTELTTTAGNRTWFGTLTLRPGEQETLRQRSFEKWADTVPEGAVSAPDWWSDPKCDYAFKFVRDEFLIYAQRYWKRLRKARHSFKYFLVFERHRSGLPHAHFLLHEMNGPILKKAMQQQWPHGFTNVKLVGGTKASARDANKAAWYAAKYLGKTYQARQIASRNYVPREAGCK